jgi:hypothetical protein
VEYLSNLGASYGQFNEVTAIRGMIAVDDGTDVHPYLLN